MVLEILRRTEGYNYSFIAYASASLNRNGTLVLNLATGPGEIEGIQLAIDDIVTTIFPFNPITITLDGVNYYASTLDGFMCTYSILNQSGPIFSSSGSTIFSKTQMQWKGKLPYQSTAVLSIKNTHSPDPASFIFVCPHRVYR